MKNLHLRGAISQVHSSNCRPKMTVEQRKKIIAGSVGNAVEYVDWAIYASLAPLFAPQFFPSGNDVAALLGILVVFAAGFLMRPVGGAVLGSFSDRHGRKKGLALSILIMSAGGFAIGLAPTYEQIGIGSPLILVCARLAQGFAAGGEYGTSSAYLVEAASAGRRAFAGSFQQVSITAGILTASGLSFTFTSTLPDLDQQTWGWRGAFIVAASLGLIALWYRTTVGESSSFEAMKDASAEASSPLRNLLRNHRKAVLTVFLVSGPISLLHYVWILYMPAFAHESFGIPLDLTLLSGTAATAVLLPILPIFGNISDRHGRRPSLIASCIGMLLLSLPAFYLIHDFWSLLMFQIAAVIFLAPYLASIAAFNAEQFPPEVRTSGIGFSYAISVALFGGTAPYIIASMNANDLLRYVWIYPTVMSVIGIITCLCVRETKSADFD